MLKIGRKFLQEIEKNGKNCKKLGKNLKFLARMVLDRNRQFDLSQLPVILKDQAFGENAKDAEIYRHNLKVTKVLKL